jgi:hypothetical protein
MAKVRVNWGSLESGCSVKLFKVYNTAHRSLLVLARDEKEAMSVAYTANHIYSPYPKTAESYSRMAYEVRCPTSEVPQSHWPLVQLAIERRLQGTVHIEDRHLAVGYEVIA